MAGSLEDALAAAPELVNQPALATAAGQSQDPQTSAQVLSHSQFMSAIQNAQMAVKQADHHDGWLGDIEHVVGKVADRTGITTALHWASKPLQEVQRDYRFVHYVYANHGIFAGTAAALGIAAGTAGGALLGGGVGAAAGADLTAAFERNIIGGAIDRKGYEWSGRGNTGVSLGRDLAHAFGLHQTDDGLGKWVSGGADALFDVSMDPLLVAGKLNAARKAGELGRIGNGRLWGIISDGSKQGDWTPLVQSSERLQGFFEKYAPGMKFADADQVTRAIAAYSPVRRAVQDIATTVHNAPSVEGAAGELVDRYPDLAPLAAAFAKSKGTTIDSTIENVTNRLREATFDTEMMSRLTGATLPSRSLMRVPTSALTEQVRTAGGDSTISGEGAGATAKLTKAQRAVKTFTGYQPFAPDPGTLELSSRTFDPSDPASLQGILRSMNFAMGRNIARQYTGRMALAMEQGNLSLAKSIWAEAQKETLKAAGLPDDPELAQFIFRSTDNAIHGSEMGGQVYGFGEELGADVSRMPIYDQPGNLLSSSPSALTADQAGDFSFPNYRNLRQAMRQMGEDGNYWAKRGMAKVGSFDEFLADHFTNSFFKPLALLSMGFGTRVALSEAIPAAIRYGAVNMLKASVAQKSAKYQWRLEDGEDSLILNAAAKAVGGVDKLINNEYDRDLAIRMVQANNGHLVIGPAATGNHQLYDANDPTSKASFLQDAWAKRNSLLRGTSEQYEITRPERMKQLLAKNQAYDRATDEWHVLRPDNSGFDDAWLEQLQKKSQQQPYQAMAADMQELFAQGKSAAEVKQEMVRREAHRISTDDLYDAAGRRKVAAYSSGERAEDFAFRRVDDISNLLKSADGTFHSDLASKLAAGEKPTIEDLAEKAGPKGIAAVRLAPYIGDSAYKRAISFGYKKLVDPVISSLSREPMWFNAVKEEYRALEPAIERGLVTEEKALSLAQRRAATAVLPQIHNIMFRSQFAQLAQNVMPFYFAQEQAIKRYGKLATINPASLRNFELLEHGLNDPGFVQTDDNGNRFLTLPTTGAVGKLFTGAASAIGLPVVTGLPMTYTGNIASLNTILPTGEEPAVGPAVSVSLNFLARQFPELAPVVKKTVGAQSFNSDLMTAMVPNTALRSIVKGYLGNESDAQFANAYATTLAEAYYHNKIPGADATPAEWQDFYAKVKSTTRDKFYLKGILAAFSPLAPNPIQGDVDKRFNETLSTEFYQLLRPKEEGGAGLDFDSAVQTMIKEHGPNVVAYTVGKTDGTAGANIPNTREALDYLQVHEGLIKDSKYASAAAFLVPQTTATDGDSQLIHAELVAMGMRQRKTPQEFVNSIYTAQGNNAYFQQKDIHDANLAAAGGNKAAEAAENARWADIQAQLKLANPIWADEFFSPDKQNRALGQLNGLLKLFADGKAPGGKQTELVQALLNDYQSHASILASLAGPASLGHKRQQEKDKWAAYLTQLAQTRPELKNVIQTIFLPLSSATDPTPSNSLGLNA